MNDILARWSGALALLAGGPTGYGPHDVEALAAATERVVAENARLRADLAEALATLANERGEGEPPEEGFVFLGNAGGGATWQRKPDDRGIGAYASRQIDRTGRVLWSWSLVEDRYDQGDCPRFYTHAHGSEAFARAAMRAAPAAAKGER